MRTLAAITLILCCVSAFAGDAPPLRREQSISIQSADGRSFPALYTPAAAARGAVIVLAIAAGDALAEALRRELPLHGYAVLAVPAPAAPSIAAPAIEQLRAAVTFLQAKSGGRIAIAAYDRAANIANDYLTQVADNGIAAWACISVSGGDLRDAAKLRVPTLDLYGENDTPQIRDKADARAAIIRKIRGSAQIELAGADHQYINQESAMATAVRQFLDQRLK
jgi:pimeloyl-ACP methyl ester carboxylesterase